MREKSIADLMGDWLDLETDKMACLRLITELSKRRMWYKYAILREMARRRLDIIKQNQESVLDQLQNRFDMSIPE